jgi:acylphosphatase
MNKNQRLHLQVKGKVHNHLYPVFVLVKSILTGVKPFYFNRNAANSVEMVLEGDVTKLWKMVDWSKSGYVFFVVEEVQFKFVEAALG